MLELEGVIDVERYDIVLLPCGHFMPSGGPRSVHGKAAIATYEENVTAEYMKVYTACNEMNATEHIATGPNKCDYPDQEESL